MSIAYAPVSAQSQHAKLPSAFNTLSAKQAKTDSFAVFPYPVPKILVSFLSRSYPFPKILVPSRSHHVDSLAKGGTR